MANEFIARKGLIVLNNGARITGSFNVSGDSNFIGPVTVASGATGSFSGSFSGDGSQLSGLVTDLRISGSTGSDTINLLTDDLSILGSNGITTTITDNTITVNLPLGAVTASSQVDHNTTTNYVANEHIDHSTVSITAGSGLSGGGNITTSRTLTLDTGSTHFTGGVKEKLNADGVFSSSIQVDITGTTGYSTFSSSIATKNDIQDVSINALNAATSSYAIDATIQSQLAGVVSSSAQVQPLLPDGTVSSSAQYPGWVTASSQIVWSQVAYNTGIVSSSGQVVIQDTTGIAAIATTGSNTFTGVQTITNTTNSTNFTNGSVIVEGGMGIAKDVNISGSLTVTGLLTAVSMSTQYVTSSQYVVGTSRVIVNDDDLVRFAGLTVIDSGSTAASGSVLWDSLKNHFIYETNDTAIHSALFIAGPETYGTLGDEAELVVGRIPVATTIHNIDNRPQSSSIRIDYPSLLTHIENGLVVTGSVTSSVGFSGDGSNLTGIVTNLNITGSDGGTGTVSLKTQALTVDGTNGLTATVSGQTVTISGSDATTTSKGVASFNSTNFTVTGGEVTSNNITINGTNVTLGGTRNITLSEITAQGATTANQVVLNGGAVIHGVLFTTGSNFDVDTGTEVVATIATGSFDAAFFDYVVKNGTNYRAGAVVAVWDDADNVEFTDTSTNDLGNTSDVVFTVDTLSGNARLKATVISDNWIVKTAVRAL
jgi:hypothetical protein